MKHIYEAKSNRGMKIGLVIVLFIYLFFFTSKLIFPPILSEATELDKEIMYSENRSVTVVSCKYSEKDKEMEVVLQFQNRTFDGINDYYYFPQATPKQKNLQVEEVLNESLITVIRIQDLKKIDELKITFAPKIDAVDKVGDEYVGSIILNKNNISYVNTIKEKTKEEYLKERLDSIITAKEEELEEKETEVGSLEEKIEGLKNENENLTKNAKYMTEKEHEEAVEEQTNNYEIITQSEESIESLNAEIEVLKTEIAEAKTTRDNIKSK